MIDTSQFSLIQVALFAFVPMFISALLLRANGIVGFLAIAGVIAVVAIILSDFSGWRLGVAGAGAALALGLGGWISDTRERKKMMLVKDEEKKKRDARLRGL
jgi:hypothetical protein